MSKKNRSDDHESQDVFEDFRQDERQKRRRNWAEKKKNRKRSKGRKRIDIHEL